MIRMSLQFLRNFICNGSKKYVETRVSIGFANFAKAVSNHIMAVFLPPYYASLRSVNLESKFQSFHLNQKNNENIVRISVLEVF